MILLTVLIRCLSLYSQAHSHTHFHSHSYTHTHIIHAGTCCEYVFCDERSVARMPTSLDFNQAAAVPLVALSAWEALFHYGQMRPGDKVLVLGAGGGVGTFAVQVKTHVTFHKLFLLHNTAKQLSLTYSHPLIHSLTHSYPAGSGQWCAVYATYSCSHSPHTLTFTHSCGQGRCGVCNIHTHSLTHTPTRYTHQIHTLTHTHIQLAVAKGGVVYATYSHVLTRTHTHRYTHSLSLTLIFSLRWPREVWCMQHAAQARETSSTLSELTACSIIVQKISQRYMNT